MMNQERTANTKISRVSLPSQISFSWKYFPHSRHRHCMILGRLARKTHRLWATLVDWQAGHLGIEALL